MSELDTDTAAEEPSLEQRFDAILEGCKLRGMAPSTLGVKALNNSKAVTQISGRIDRTKAQIERLERFMSGPA